MLIAQVSDLHVGLPDGRTERVFRTTAHLERAVAHLNALRPRPDVAIATGDLVDGGRVEEYRRLRALLDALEMPLFLVPGNHDDPANLARVFDHHRYLPRDGSPLQYAIEDWPVRLVGLDTTIAATAGGRLSADRLAWLDGCLAEAPACPTLVFMHHPPFVTGLTAMDGMGLDDIGAFAALVARHPQIERIACGHVHRVVTRRFAGTVVCTSPSTAHQVALDLPPSTRLAMIMEPPACTLHLWLGADDALVSHVSLIDTARPPLTLFDGVRWVRDAEPPAGFHPDGAFGTLA